MSPSGHSLHYSQVFPHVNRFIDNCDYEFINRISDSGSLSSRFIRDKIYGIFKNSFYSRDKKTVLGSTTEFIKYNFAERYIPEIIQNHKEASIVIRNEMPAEFSPHDFSDYLNTVFLIRPFVYTLITGQFQGIDRTSEADLIVSQAAAAIKPLPYKIADTAVKSFFKDISDTGSFLHELTRIFDYICRMPLARDIREKAALTPELSWFKLARHNSDFFGFNDSFIEALILIAGEKKW